MITLFKAANTVKGCPIYYSSFLPQTLGKDGVTPRIKHHSIIESGEGYMLSGHYSSSQSLVHLVMVYMSMPDPSVPETVRKHPCIRLSPVVHDISPDVRDQWEINANEVIFDQMLGKGNFGEVWSGECWRLRVTVALPCILRTKLLEWNLDSTHWKGRYLSEGAGFLLFWKGLEKIIPDLDLKYVYIAYT